jgi:TonB C terminal
MRFAKIVFIIISSLMSFKGVLAQGVNQTETVVSEQKPTMSGSKPTNGQGIPGFKNPADKSEATKLRTGMSIAAYKNLIASKIAARARVKNPAGAGEVQAAFRVNEEGHIDQIIIKKSSSPALAEHVKRILSGVSAPPPPEGPLLLGQPFNFN